MAAPDTTLAIVPVLLHLCSISINTFDQLPLIPATNPIDLCL